MRLIDADALKRRAQKVATESWKMSLTANVETVLNQFIDWIDQADTAEPERKHGRWIKSKPRGVVSYSKAYADCDQCNEPVYFGWYMKFCPHCGARMDGESE